ncbi:MAG: hypothetical protein JWM05_1794 [Acidimicrobiales bacterium]|nr:hypothetical protein [Acidimicrobiales bacterium]
MEPVRIVLSGGGAGLATQGPVAALYVMEAANGGVAKIGALERSRNAEQRVRDVQRGQRKRETDPAAYPIRLAVIAELDGLDVTGPDADEAWSRTVHYETLMRFVIARRVGRLHAWPDWIYIDRHPDQNDWAAEFRGAWSEVLSIGHHQNSTW